jgi:hypothetical protein
MNGIVMLVLGTVLGAVFFYFFLRANPKKKALLDKQADRLK